MSQQDGFHTFLEGVFVGGISGVIANDLSELVWNILDPAVEKACDGMDNQRKSMWKRIVRLGVLIIVAYAIVMLLTARRNRISAAVMPQ